MKKIEQLSKSASRLSSPLAEWILKRLSFSRQVDRFLKSLEIKRICRIFHFKKLLVISDVHIGDAVLIQSVIPPFKKYFPDLKIGYVYQSKAHPLIKANPYIDMHYPIFDASQYSRRSDFIGLKDLLKGKNFDLILNICPYLPKSIFKSVPSPVISAI